MSRSRGRFLDTTAIEPVEISPNLLAAVDFDKLNRRARSIGGRAQLMTRARDGLWVGVS